MTCFDVQAFTRVDVLQVSYMRPCSKIITHGSHTPKQTDCFVPCPTVINHSAFFFFFFSFSFCTVVVVMS